MVAIHLRNLPPPDETFDHIEFLSLMARWIKPERYLELGVRDGRNFVKVAPFCSLAIGVDILPVPFGLEGNMEFHQTTTDNYLKSLPSSTEFDMVFIDADHSHKQSLKDFQNVFPYVIDDGFIFFHDTYPCLPYMFDPSKSNNCYLTPKYIKKNMRDKCEILTLPFNPGVTVVKKIPGNRQLAYQND